MTKSFLTKKIFSIFAIFIFVLISTTTLAHAGVIQNIKYFLFGEPTVPTVTTTPITNPSTGSGQAPSINSGQAPSTSSGQTNTTVVVPPSTSGISENDIYLALTKISRLPDNIISQLRGPQGPQGQKGDTGAKGSSGLSTYSNTGNTPVVTPPATTIVYTGSSGGSSSSASYWKKDGHDIYYDKGNVGVGTNSPQDFLHILAPINERGLTIEGDRFQNGNVDLTLINNTPGGNTWVIDSAGEGSGYGAGNLGFGTDPDGNALMVLTDTGNLGIGTNTPEAKIQIQSSDSVEKIVNGDFDGNADHWILGTGWAYDGDKITHTPGGVENAHQSVSLSKGKTYFYSITATDGPICLLAGDQRLQYLGFGEGGTASGTFTAQSNISSIILDVNDCTENNGMDGSVSSVSIQELSSVLALNKTNGDIGLNVDNASNLYVGGKLALGNKAGIGGGEYHDYPTPVLDIEQNSTDSQVMGIETEILADPVENGANIYGMGGGIGTAYLNPHDINTIVGSNIFAYHNGTGTVDRSSGIETSVNNYNNGTITNVKAGVFGAYNAGTMTNTYGVYIDDVTSGTQTNQAYGLYQSDVEARNYFAGNLGIGNDSPSVALDVTGDIEYTGTITDVSDRRLKDNIQDYTGALDIISNLQAKSYNMISTPDKNEVGFIAQDVESIFPNATSIIDPEKGYLGVSYVSLVPVIAQAVKELNLKLLDINKIEEPNSIREAIVAWFGNTTNGIVDFFAGRVHTETLCVGTNGDETCITKGQLDQLLQGNSIIPATPPTPDPTPYPDPIPTPDPEPTPDPSPEVTPPSDPVPEVVPPTDPAPEPSPAS